MQTAARNRTAVHRLVSRSELGRGRSCLRGGLVLIGVARLVGPVGAPVVRSAVPVAAAIATADSPAAAETADPERGLRRVVGGDVAGRELGIDQLLEGRPDRRVDGRRISDTEVGGETGDELLIPAL